MDEKIVKKLKKIRGLKQYKGLEEDELVKIAEKLVNEEETPKGLADVIIKEKLDIDVEELFIEPAEQDIARKLTNKYTEEYSIDNVSDKNTLKQLIYFEVVHFRLQALMNELYKGNREIPLKVLESLQSNIETINTLKEKLGLSKEKGSDSYALLQRLQKKFKIWREQNQGSRSLGCPHCGKMILLKIRTTAWEAQKHPFFKDRIYGNPTLIRLFKENRLTQEEVAEILGTSPEYVVWLIERWQAEQFNAPEASTAKETGGTEDSSFNPDQVPSVDGQKESSSSNVEKMDEPQPFKE